jgi:hypothetical protein
LVGLHKAKVYPKSELIKWESENRIWKLEGGKDRLDLEGRRRVVAGKHGKEGVLPFCCQGLARRSNVKREGESKPAKGAAVTAT